MEGEVVTAQVLYDDPDYRITDYEWHGNQSIDCDTCAIISYTPKSNEDLKVTIIDMNGCLTDMLIQIDIEELPRQVYTPNAISKNGLSNGNSQFTIYGAANIDIVQELSIYDRWGSRVFNRDYFNANDPSVGWDGTYNGSPLNPGKYTYNASVRFLNGEVLHFTGTILLIN